MGKCLPVVLTAAGKSRPAKVFVLGAGGGGWQAIATAKRLGAVVDGYDARAAVKEQVESLGARFVELDLPKDEAETKGGYAKQMSEEFLTRQRAELAKCCAQQDIVITTALVFGKKAPLLLTADAVKAMKAGSVIVDLAAERGGNCELTSPGKTVVESGVTILGPTTLPGEVRYHASQMYAKNISTFLLNLFDDGRINLHPSHEHVLHTLTSSPDPAVPHVEFDS